MIIENADRNNGTNEAWALNALAEQFLEILRVHQVKDYLKREQNNCWADATETGAQYAPLVFGHIIQ